jgi:hypothetical protein
LCRTSRAEGGIDTTRSWAHYAPKPKEALSARSSAPPRGRRGTARWREASHTRELADESLRRFRAEILTNRKAVAAVKDYHATTLKSLQSYLAADPKMRSLETVQIKGVQPAFFEHTAWDLALATQSLAHIDPPVAFALSRIYGTQQTYAELTRGFVQAMYLRPLTESFEGLSYYYGDLVFMEPALLRLYDEALPQIDRELAE